MFLQHFVSALALEAPRGSPKLYQLLPQQPNDLVLGLADRQFRRGLDGQEEFALLLGGLLALGAVRAWGNIRTFIEVKA